ncbi:hypothetical protein FACI_IFERC00001G0472 [Ferroplasma acidarmanus Fer1]|uniref:Uncharacterized protein n=1 Tax=Ferroplasma acidarmanus Fer1 TaxID=333146 RepID=S0ANW3_FERAC|nr:hypothetical protein FACI_IFERC00001G0472 [Ferroplasma acidarmanus Fer1]
MLAHFSSNINEIMELIYEYSEPYILDDRKFLNEYPEFRHTTYDDGINNTINWFKNEYM